MFGYGEIGHKKEEHFDSLEETIESAIDHSIAMGTTTIGVSNESEELIYVVIEGKVFKEMT